jgi:GH25 family lysozyme M1 (1,4-beta-N-acetylmuramidase)
MISMRGIIKRLLSVFLCFVMVLCMLPKVAVPVSAENGYDRGYDGCMAGDGKIYAHGLDVSAWQESGLNFRNFANAGYDYVILRCGTSYGKDKCFEEYYASAKAAGLDVGCYYYSYAKSVAEAKSEAYDMISWMGDKLFEYPIYFDYEDPSQSSISGTVAAQICYAFMDVLKENGYLVGLYSMASWLEQSWVTSSGLRNTYEGWVAHLTVSDKVSNSGISSSYYDDLLGKYGTRYGMHQYSFSTYVNGAGPFDANVSFKDYPAIVKKFGFNGYDGATETWVERACFDVMVYRDRNPDLGDMTDAELKAHWRKSGIKEGRASSPVLDLGFYLNNNPDLQAAFGNDYEKVYQHFITKGYKEYRKSSALFDGAYYCENNPDVASSFKEEYLRHYIENGMAEGRRASLTFDPDYYWFIRPDVYEVWPGSYSMCAKHYAGHGINAQLEAYDHEHPVISDVTISDITADGYTVTCKVNDDWGISKVAFPTWTILNNQDDLAADFMNTQLGTKDGDTYSFRVNASDHNNEIGYYVTHIYAIDNGGNRTTFMLEPVEVKNPEAEKITLISSTTYEINNGLLLNTQANTTVETLLSQFENVDLKVLDSDGNEITNKTLIGTGATINLFSGDTLVDSVAVIISGDVDGNGRVNATDYARIKSAFLGTFSFNTMENIAADVDGNGVIDTTDYLRIKAHFLEMYNLYA